MTTAAVYIHTRYEALVEDGGANGGKWFLSAQGDNKLLLKKCSGRLGPIKK